MGKLAASAAVPVTGITAALSCAGAAGAAGSKQGLCILNILEDLEALPPYARGTCITFVHDLAEGERRKAALPSGTTSRFDHDAARKRLHAISDDPAVLDGFERLVQSGDFDDAFLQATYDADISFDYMLFGDGTPFMTA